MIENILSPVIDHHSVVLIVGSMPGVQSLEKQQYYGNPRNHFWLIMEYLLGERMPGDYEERLNILLRHKIALWDVIKACVREGSLDSNIKGEIPNDFITMLKKYPNIKAIAFNGTKARETFRKKIGFEQFPNIDFYQLPSSSPVPGRNVKTLAEKMESWTVLKQVLKG